MDSTYTAYALYALGAACGFLFYLVDLPEKISGYVNLSTASAWEWWIRKCLPEGLDQEVQRRLVSNFKHVLVGLEILFESYFHIPISNFAAACFRYARV